MAAPTIKDALAAETFDLKDEIITALEAAGITDPQRIYRYGGNALLKTPMEEVKAFVDSKLKPHKAELASTDPDVLTAVADFVAALVSKVPVASAGAAASTATTASSGGSLDKERAAADAFAQERYAAVAQATLYRVSAKDRLASKIVKRLSDEIDRGTICGELQARRPLQRSFHRERVKDVGRQRRVDRDVQGRHLRPRPPRRDPDCRGPVPRRSDGRRLPSGDAARLQPAGGLVRHQGPHPGPGPGGPEQDRLGALEPHARVLPSVPDVGHRRHHHAGAARPSLGTQPLLGAHR